MNANEMTGWLWILTWKSTLLLLLAGLIYGILKCLKSSPTLRHGMWVVIFLIILFLPGFTFLLPTWYSVPQGLKPLSRIAYAMPETTSQEDSIAAEPLPVIHEAGLITSPPLDSVARRTFSLHTWIILVWGTGSFGVLCYGFMGQYGVSRLIGKARELPSDDWRRQTLDRYCRERVILAKMKLVESSLVSVPWVTGVIRPVMMVPENSRTWTEERFRVVAIHETAHVQRRDLLTGYLAWMVCSLLWFHPLIWWSSRRMKDEAEKSCDLAVIARGIRPESYVEHLMEIIQQAKIQSSLPALTASMARTSRLEERLRSVFAPVRHQGWAGTILGVGTLLTLGFSIILILGMSPLARAQNKMGVSSSAVSQPMKEETQSQLFKPGVSVFRSTCVLVIDPSGYQVIDAKPLIPVVMTREYLNTQSRIIAGSELAGRVIRSLNLMENQSFVDAFKMPVNSPEKAGQALQKMVSVTPVTDTYLINISCDHPDGPLAAQIAEGFAKEYIRYMAEQYASIGMAAQKWMRDQIEELKINAEKKEKNLIDYAEQFDMAEVKTKDPKTYDRLKVQYDTLLHEAAEDRQMLQALNKRYREVQVFGALNSNNIRIIERASVPTAVDQVR